MTNSSAYVRQLLSVLNLLRSTPALPSIIRASNFKADGLMAVIVNKKERN